MTDQDTILDKPNRPARMGGRPKGTKDTEPRRAGKSRPKSTRVKDYLHMRFGHLTVVARGPKNHGKPGGSVPALWHCVCDCGEMKLTTSRALSLGEIRTCGNKGCPFRAAIFTENLRKTKDNLVIHAAMDKVGKVGFCLSADDVRKLLHASCKICGHTGPGHEIRCYEHKKGYTINNSYSICDGCKGIVPIMTGYHLSWDKVVAKLAHIITYLTLTGDLAPGPDKAFRDLAKAISPAKPNEDINDIPLAF